ncbi:SIR2 family NAD-dependent protein deacylase [Ornithinimicrobium sufpigmenti]|uniref:SIR2 family NAD-dependent protein deacylase n=1 Tax=Ornithinimicrobium sufpigmenti TaxID=2508882 RepID=UPI0010355906|nr:MULTISPECIES: NAD-dependent protein deacylase [unclassified Ornithinimicrobium]
MTDDLTVPPRVLDLARHARRVCVLTGAGMSAESGLPTFRDVQVGLWEAYDPMELATAEAWTEDPGHVWAWYAWRADLVRRSEPNAGHRALTDWQRRPGVSLSVVTQNVDDLHERAGSEVLAHVHGSLFALRCSGCGLPSEAEYPSVPEPVSHLEPPVCQRCEGLVRPGVVWFGEALPQEEFYAGVEAAQSADLVLVVGTSGLVHPAATIPHLAGARGVPVVEINPRETEVSEAADVTWRATAATALPALVAELEF